MAKVVIMFDFDGTILDTMGKHADLAAKCIHSYFGMPPKVARKQYLATTGVPFSKQLEEIFPDSGAQRRDACKAEYVSRKEKEVYEAAKPFKDVWLALRSLKSKGFDLIISSSTEASLIDQLLKKHGLRQYFSGIYGQFEGSKLDHINTVRVVREHPKLIAFVGDSKSDVVLRREGAGKEVFTVGRAGRKRQGMLKRGKLLRSGATIVTVDLRHLADIDFEKALGKAEKGKRYRRGPIRFAKMLARHLRRK